MTKTEFDVALDYMMSVPPRDLKELQRDLRKLKLRIVPSEPVAWWDGDRSSPGIAFAHNVFDKIPLFADPEDSK